MSDLRTQATPDVPPVLSAEFWEQPELRSALLSRHFGRLLRTYRTSQSPRSNRPSWPTGSASLRVSSAGSSDLPHRSATFTSWTHGRAYSASRQIDCGSAHHPLPAQAKLRRVGLP